MTFIPARRIAWALGSTACLLGLMVVTAPARPPYDVVTAWASGPLEVVVSLPQPAEPDAVAGLVGRSIPYYSHEADAPFPDPSAEPLGVLKIGGARAEDEGRILVLATDPHPVPAMYVLDLEGVSRHVRVGYTLDGVEASWFEGAEPGAEPNWTGWMRTLSLRGVRLLAQLNQNPRHERWANDLAKPGRLRLDTQVRFPVSGKVEATITSPVPVVECLFGDGEPEGGVVKAEDGSWKMTTAIEDASQPVFLSLTVETGVDGVGAAMKIDYKVDGEAPTDRKPVRFLLPWASPALAASAPEPLAIPDLSGGDPARGEQVFFSKEALCSQCHVVRGRGGPVGPDLTDVGRKGSEYLYRSLALPSETIVPDFVTYTVSMKDGRVAAGVVRAEGADAVRVTDTEAKVTVIPRDEIEEIRAGTTSIMPVGLVPVLGEDRLRDLVAYLIETAKK
ncbi:c-type cytochrome [Planctomyces sp. SH-PL62]|uniref:c-type cytochrome n=1 Tax=Planctomyces sp. SH-PL62 TaxID=1636152 RepID=UPI00078CF2E9|nr:c-type cytochrome [Planctomyces sp. SH-PL62]AMV38159.1 hypothetical protein VT85_12025 [Planctomyces sp. SH-PL62]